MWWKRHQRKADYARIAELEKELGIHQPPQLIKVNEVIVEVVEDSTVTVQTVYDAEPVQVNPVLMQGWNWMFGSVYSRVDEQTFRTSPDPKVRETAWKSLWEAETERLRSRPDSP